MSEKLEDLITGIEARLACVEETYPSDKALRDQSSWFARQKAYRAIVDDLVVAERAKYKQGDADVLTIAGIRTSCTAGNHGLLHGWVRRAKVEIAKGKGEAS